MTKIELLINGRLQPPFTPYRNNEKVLVAAGWAPWWLEATPNAPSWKNRPPVYSTLQLDGQATQQLATPFGTHTGGLWQQIPTAPDNEYEITAEGQAWSSEDAAPGSQLEASDVNMQIGIDPTGGLDPESPLIIWSDPAQPLSHWETLRVHVKAETNVMTLFLKSAPSLPKRQQSVFWRHVALRPIGVHKRALNIVGQGDTHITIEPENPQPGDVVEVTVGALRKHEFVSLLVRGTEDGETAVSAQGTIVDGDRTLWRYTFTPTQDGLYELRFVGDNGARLLALRLLRVAREVQLVPGKPRENYRRVYVLLPPTADRTWAEAAVRGGFDGRFTVGYSADDAGFGDIEEKYVLAVNPHHWPEVLTAVWFQQHYPGVRFTAVIAKSPADLEHWLRKWTPEEN
ncbi:MAG: hypothetical protein Kow0080_34290 [Candidatus Promineifilaceae bacterium]